MIFKKKVLSSISAAILILVAFYFLFVYEMSHIVKLTSAPTPSIITGKSINFDKTGHFTRSSPEYGRKEFYLIYEEPGAPALTARLYFDGKNACVINGASSVCDVSLIETGVRIRVLGTKQQNYVIVRQLFVL